VEPPLRRHPRDNEKNPRERSVPVLKEIYKHAACGDKCFVSLEGDVTSIQSTLVSAIAGCDENDPRFG